MKIIILGDKYQKGSKSQGCAGLIKINNNSNILENQYLILKSSFPDSKIFYVYGFDNKKIISYFENKKLNINFIYNEKYDEYNEGFSLSLIKEYIDSETLIISGYNIFSPNCFKKFDTTHSQVFVDNSENSKIGCIINNKNILENIFYDLDNKIHSMFYLNKPDAIIFNNLLQSKIYNAFLFELINTCISSGCNIKLKNLNKNIRHYKTTNNTKQYEKH